MGRRKGIQSLCGLLSNWLLEIRAGVLVGDVSARIRDRLWDMICSNKSVKSACLIYNYPTIQGFAIKTCGENRREIIDIDGIQLVFKTKEL